MWDYFGGSILCSILSVCEQNVASVMTSEDAKRSFRELPPPSHKVTFCLLIYYNDDDKAVSPNILFIDMSTLNHTFLSKNLLIFTIRKKETNYLLHCSGLLAGINSTAI